MLFVFRGTRNLQVILAIIAMALALACVLLLKQYVDGGSPLLLILAVLLGLNFLWGFATTLRVPTSFVAVADERTRIRFAGFIDTVVDNREILGARVVNQSLLGGVGVRTNFRGTLNLVTATGPACELTFARPIRVWLIPRLLPGRGRILRVSVRNPEKMVERFGDPATGHREPALARTPAKKRRR